MNDEHIRNLFQIIRELPPEVELSGIEQFVLAQPAGIYQLPGSGGSSNSWLTLKNTIIMISSVSVIGSAILFLGGGGGESRPSASQVLPPNTPQHIALLADSAPDAPDTPAAPKKGQGEALATGPSSYPFSAYVDTAPPAYGTMYGPNSAPTYAAWKSAKPKPEAPAEPAQSHSQCDDEQHMVSTIEAELLKDGLINGKRFRFFIDADGMLVNGKKLSNDQFAKYVGLYKRQTGKTPNPEMRVEVSVNENHCSVSINDGSSESESSASGNISISTGVTGTGNGTVSLTVDNSSMEEFTTVELLCEATVEIRKGDTYSVDVIGGPGDEPNIITEVSEKQLMILGGNAKGHSKNSIIRVVVTMPDRLESISIMGNGNVSIGPGFTRVVTLAIMGNGNISATAGLQSPGLSASIMGHGNIDVWNLTAPTLSVSIPGNGNVNVEGTVNDLEVDILGKGTVTMDRLLAQKAQCTINGSGNITVQVALQLSADILGSGNIEYSGNPTVTKTVQGNGHVTQR